MNYKISDLSKIFDISTTAIRKYEDLGYIFPTRNNGNGYRLYSDEDVSRICLVRMYVKSGFSHNEILKLLDSNIERQLDGYRRQLEKMDDEIERLKSLRHRMKDNIVLFNRINEFRTNITGMDAVPVYYVLYKRGSELLTNEKNAKTVKQYLYDAPESQLIYLFKKEDIDNKTGMYSEGISVKEKYVQKLCLEKNEYTTYYPTCSAVHILVESHKNIFDDVIEALEKNNVTPNADIIGVKFADARENGVIVKYVLICVPIRETPEKY